jgi:glycosyltransferase involved in cell wall biosynthesis
LPTILAYVHAYVPDHNAGAETTLHDILRFLVSEGWEAHVVVLQPYEKEYSIDGVQVHVSGNRKKVLECITTADITISHLEHSKRTHLVSQRWNKPSVHLVHNTHPLTKQWAASSDALIFNTDWVSEHKNFSEFTQPWMVARPAVDPERYKVSRGKSVTLINLWPDKGADIFYQMAEEFPQVPFVGVIGGYGEQVIRDLPNVTIMEHTSDMKKVYGQTKVLLMPSKYESYGRVGVEAMASGIPVIAHPTEGLRESLGDAGTFVDRDLPGEWKKSLSDLLKPARYGKMSKLATERSDILYKQSSMELQNIPMFFSELIRTKTGKRF